jgi:hypothetical protein
MIARQAQGVRAGEVIAKLAEDTYFMRVNNRVTQVPPLRTHEPRHHEATSRRLADGGRNCSYNHRTPTAPGPQLEDPPRVAIVQAALAEAAAALIAAMAAAHHTVLAGELVVAAIVEAEATQTTTSPASHTMATTPATELKRFVAKRLLKKVTATTSPPSPLDFATCFSQRNSSLSRSPSTTRSKTQFSGLGAMPYVDGEILST